MLPASQETTERLANGVETRTVMPIEVIADYVKKVVPLYRTDLLSQLDDGVPLDELEERKKAELDRHLLELGILVEVLDQMVAKAPFRLVEQSQKHLVRAGSPRDTYTARFAPANKPLPEDRAHLQNQLGFHANISASTEGYLDAIRSLSLRGSAPADVLARAFRQSTEQRVNINTVGVYLGEYRQPVIRPQAGITIRWRGGESFARVGGLAYVYDKAHERELIGVQIPFDDFVSIQRTVMILSRLGAKNKPAGK